MDHESLKWLSSQKEFIGRKVCWVQILEEFDLQLHYQKGCGRRIESDGDGK